MADVPGTTVCCGLHRKTLYCPQCGKALQHSLRTLRAHCFKQEQSLVEKVKLTQGWVKRELGKSDKEDKRLRLQEKRVKNRHQKWVAWVEALDRVLDANEETL